MPKIPIQNLTRPLDNPLSVRQCAGFFQRFVGLMFHPPLKPDDGILLIGRDESQMDASIHMLFMRMDITVVWMNRALEVVDVKIAKKWRPMYAPSKPAIYTLEISSDRLSEFSIGDRLHFELG